MTKKQTLRAVATALAVTAGAFVTGPAKAIDVGPADYTIMPEGTQLGMLYWQHLRSGKLVLGGDEVPGSKFTANVAILRSLTYSSFNDMPVAFHVVAPFANIDTARIGGGDQPVKNGMGDLTLGVTVWPIQPDTPDTGTTLGLSLFATLPTGSYAPGSIGIGEGTTTLTPQIGVIQGLGGGWYFDGVFDVGIQASHRENGVTHKRDPSVQLQTMLRKQWGQGTSLTIGYSGQRGGDQMVAGAKTGLKTDRDQIRLYGTHFLTPTLQIQGMVAKDINVEGGFEYDTVTQLRLVKVF